MKNNEKIMFFHFLLRSPVILLFLRYLIFPHFSKKHFFNACSDLGPPGASKKIDRSFLALLGRRLGPRTCFQDRLGTFQKSFKAKSRIVEKHLGFPSKVEPWRTLGDPGAPPNRPHGPAHASRGPPASELGRQTHVLGPSLGPPENPTGPHLTKHMFC